MVLKNIIEIWKEYIIAGLRGGFLALEQIFETYWEFEQPMQNQKNHEKYKFNIDVDIWKFWINICLEGSIENRKLLKSFVRASNISIRIVNDSEKRKCTLSNGLMQWRYQNIKIICLDPGFFKTACHSLSEPIDSLIISFVIWQYTIWCV